MNTVWCFIDNSNGNRRKADPLSTQNYSKDLTKPHVPRQDIKKCNENILPIMGINRRSLRECAVGTR